jgi:hypothetical protein
MSRTYRKTPLRNQFRHPRTFNELKNREYLDSEYMVSTRNRYIPTAYDDIIATSIRQNDHHS